MTGSQALVGVNVNVTVSKNLLRDRREYPGKAALLTQSNRAKKSEKSLQIDTASGRYPPTEVLVEIKAR